VVQYVAQLKLGLYAVIQRHANAKGMSSRGALINAHHRSIPHQALKACVETSAESVHRVRHGDVQAALPPSARYEGRDHNHFTGADDV
jgi:hypothetical protein